MPKFIYKARDHQGRERQSAREAVNQEELVNQLQSEGFLVTQVVREEVVKRTQAIGISSHVRVTIDDLILFARQLATMLDAGVTLLKSLDVLTKQVESRALLEAVQEIKQDISAGSTFRDALAKHPRIFSDFWVHIVETGEASGALPVTLSQLAEYLESAASMRRKVVSSLMYPSVLIAMAMVALTIFTVWIIPVFARVFDSFDVELPLITMMVVNFSKMVRRFILVIFAILVASGYFIARYLRTEQGKLQFDQLMLKLPVISSLVQQIAIERFASGLATLIDSGVPILYGLDIIGKATGNKVMDKAILEVRESVRQGKGMARPLEQSGVFTPMVVQMVSVGEEIGELGKMLRKISDFYKERIATTLTRVTTMIEPAVLILMGVVIGVMVIAMFLPIFQLATVRGE